MLESFYRHSHSYKKCISTQSLLDEIPAFRLEGSVGDLVPVEVEPTDLHGFRTQVDEP